MHKDYKKLRKQITLAFIELRKQGFIAKQDWACCTNCGFADILDEINEKYLDRLDKLKGFVFFHCQSLEILKETGEAWLAWGVVKEDATDECFLIAGKNIVAILKKFNMRVIWDGKISTKICVVLKNNSSIIK